jgi:acetyl-CoA carboxylase carboxyl transferase subunit beta
MGWFNTVKSPKLKNIKKTSVETPEGIWKKCTSCGEIVQATRLKENNQVCPYCQFHYRIDAASRIELLLDKESFREYHAQAASSDPLAFVDKIPYADRLKQAVSKSGLNESSIVGTGKIDGMMVSLCVMDFAFMGGSMGSVTGEKVATAMELALKHECPCIVISCSGGARMQEGILSLMQMAKTSALRNKLKEKAIAYISVLTDPTTGGTAASYAMLGDVNLAEPNALIGFAGPRVIEQSIRETLPEGFQRSEFLLEHGFVDRIVARKDLRSELAYFVKMFNRK